MTTSSSRWCAPDDRLIAERFQDSRKHAVTTGALVVTVATPVAGTRPACPRRWRPARGDVQ